MKKLAAVIGLLVVCHSIQSQQWVKAQRESGNIYDAIEMFEVDQEGNVYQKGQGIKQFERWRNFWEPRLFPSGEFSQISSDYYTDFFSSKQNLNSAKDGSDWQPLGLDSWETNSYGPGNGRINCIHPDPNNDGVIYIGTPSGGLWRSEDSGASWEPLTDHLPTLGVSAIAVDHSNSNTIYIATGDCDGQDTYGIGVLKSTDNGETWNTTGLSLDLGENIKSHRMLQHPVDANLLFAATSDGLYKTNNAGLTWIKVLSGIIYDIEFKPGDPSIVYACKDRFYKSTDSGDSFSPLNGQLPNSSQIERISIAVTDAEPDYVYCLVADDVYSAFMGLYRSMDSGETFELRSDSPNILSSNLDGNSLGGQAWYDMEIAVSNENADQVITGGVNLWESSNGGQSWSINSHWLYEQGMIPNYVHADIHHLEYEGDLLYCGSDGGIFRSNNDGDDFDDLSAGLEISQFYRFDVNDNDGSMVIGGTQDNGTNLLEDDSWTHVLGADGMKAIIDPENSDIMYACTQWGSIHKSTNGGDSFDWSSSGINENGAWVTPYIMSPINNDVLFAGYENVWRSNDGADSWSPISSNINQQLRSIAMGMSDPNTIYSASYTDIHRTTNGGSDWDNVSDGLPSASISFIAVHPIDAQKVWVTFSGFSEYEKVYFSEDGGDNWINISDNLPNIPVNCISLDHQNDNGLYIGTDVGIYYTNDDLAHWEPFVNGLPNVIVNEIEVHWESGSVFCATFGRGIWTSPQWTASNDTPYAHFDQSRAYLCEGESMNFSDMSVGNTPEWEWSFEGGNPDTSSEANPEITYDTAGEYDVTLTVSNANGESSSTCEACIIVLPADGSEPPMIEGFEDSDEFQDLNWYTNEGGWEITDDAAVSGSQSAFIHNYNIDVESIHELWSEPVDLSDVPDNETALISFEYAYCQMAPNNDDRLRLFISEDCSQTWTLRGQWAGLEDLQTAALQEDNFVPGENDWIYEVVEIPTGDLSSTTSFMFAFTNDNGNNLYIDDINIWSDEVSVSEVFEDLVELWPNPVSDAININVQTSCHMTIFDIQGKQVASNSLSSGTSSIDCSSWEAGVYTVRLQSESGLATRKILIQ